MKTKEVKDLERMYVECRQRKYPDGTFLTSPSYEERTREGLIKCIIDYLRLNDIPADNNDQTQMFSETMGRVRRISAADWEKLKNHWGKSPISAIINGLTVKIEILRKGEIQSADQIAYQQLVEAAGGIYCTARSLASFKEWIKTQLQKEN